MLPLLPALLLLILQGPSSVERMALDGRLPAALEAIHRHMESRDHQSPAVSKADEAMLASLLALSSDPQVSHALIKLLSLGEPFQASSGKSKLVIEAQDESPPSAIVEGDAAIPVEGFAESQRSRDGPFARAA